MFFFISTSTLLFLFSFSFDKHRVAERHCDFRVNQIEPFLSQHHVLLRGWTFRGKRHYCCTESKKIGYGSKKFVLEKNYWSKTLSWQSVLRMAVFAWTCIHFAENGPPHSLRCLCISLRLFDFWDFSEPLWTKKNGALLRFLFHTLDKTIRGFVGFEGSAMWLVPLIPAAWYGTGTCKMSKKT